MRYTTSMDQEMKRRVTACAAGFSLPRYRELPAVGLYLDQTVQLVNSCFRGFPGVELTPSMVSNYVKKGVISHPVKKKYSREQLAALLYIVLSKNVLSLENIEMLFRMQRAHCTAAEAYDSFCDEVENCLPFIFGVWVVSHDAVQKKLFHSDPGALMRQGRDWSLSHMDVILDLTGHGCPLSREELTVYYNEGLTFSLGERELQGLSLFYRKLADARMIPGVPPLRFFHM